MAPAENASEAKRANVFDELQAETGSTGRKVTLKVWRGDKSGGEFRDYEVPVTEGMVVLDAVHWLQAHTDGSIACRWNCKAAKCGSCSAEIDGKPKLMCKTRLDDLGDTITVHPMKTFPILKDLATDVSWNYEINKKIPPFTPAATEKSPYVMAQKDVDRMIEFRKCIECFLCQDVCHVLRNHDGNPRFYGPRFMVRVASLEMHPKDTLDRTPILKGEGGVGMCNITKCCTEVCPEHIHITDNAIIPLKERMIDQYYDPLQLAWRAVTGKPSADEKLAAWREAQSHALAAGGTGFASVRALLADVSFPRTRDELVKSVGSWVVATPTGAPLTLAEVLARIPEKLYRSAASVVSEVESSWPEWAS
ncbi:MAG: succinate dehydrogenase/fumarate reductase iron-sulfur subunit [Thermoplasmatota archaeon]